MSRHIVPLFDQNRQLFIKIEVLQSADTFWLRGQEYRWKDIEIPVEKRCAPATVTARKSQGNAHVAEW